MSSRVLGVQRGTAKAARYVAQGFSPVHWAFVRARSAQSLHRERDLRQGGIYDRAGFRRAQLAFGHFPSASEVARFSTASLARLNILAKTQKWTQTKKR